MLLVNLGGAVCHKVTVLDVVLFCMDMRLRLAVAPTISIVCSPTLCSLFSDLEARDKAGTVLSVL